MEISTILHFIDNGQIALPEFQRGYVWNRDQVKGLVDSLYRRHPVGGLLVWATESKTAEYRGDSALAGGIVKLLLDGQQRITSLYGVIRGKPPEFFEGNENVFKGLYFHLEKEVFSFYMPSIMSEDPLWISVTDLMIKGNEGLGGFVSKISAMPVMAEKVGIYAGRLSKLLAIKDINLHVEEVTGEDKSIEIVVDIFNRVNSGGTKLSKGDLALAKICADWPEARDKMKNVIKEWEDQGYHFDLDWLLRSVNTVLTGEAKFQYLHERSVDEIKEAFQKAVRHINTTLNMIEGRLGLDHDRVLFGRFAIPVIVNYLERLNGSFNEKERDKLLFWYVQAGMWGRFSGSTESYIDKDLSVLDEEGNEVDNLIEQLRLWHGGLRVEPGHFTGWSLGARFYPLLYLLTRMSEAKDWGTGLPLKANLHGKMNRLEVHHIFPKAQLYKYGYDKKEVNAIANFCFLTKDTNLNISDRRPEDYFPEIADNHPGALESQWIPADKEIWKIENYRAFLEARKALLAESANHHLEELLHGDTRWLEETASSEEPELLNVGIESDEEEEIIYNLNQWVQERGLPAGEVSYGFADSNSGDQIAVFDLAWPNGLQKELSQPVAVLINEKPEIISLANNAGYRCFLNDQDFKQYVLNEIIKESALFDTAVEK